MSLLKSKEPEPLFCSGRQFNYGSTGSGFATLSRTQTFFSLTWTGEGWPDLHGRRWPNYPHGSGRGCGRHQRTGRYAHRRRRRGNDGGRRRQLAHLAQRGGAHALYGELAGGEGVLEVGQALLQEGDKARLGGGVQLFLQPGGEVFRLHPAIYQPLGNKHWHFFSQLYPLLEEKWFAVPQGSVVDPDSHTYRDPHPDPHHFGNLDPHADPHPHQKKIRIQIGIKVLSWIRNRMRINLQVISQNVRYGI
jgi:hypothetical protein